MDFAQNVSEISAPRINFTIMLGLQRTAQLSGIKTFLLCRSIQLHICRDTTFWRALRIFCYAALGHFTDSYDDDADDDADDDDIVALLKIN